MYACYVEDHRISCTLFCVQICVSILHAIVAAYLAYRLTFSLPCAPCLCSCAVDDIPLPCLNETECIYVRSIDVHSALNFALRQTKIVEVIREQPVPPMHFKSCQIKTQQKCQWHSRVAQETDNRSKCCHCQTGSMCQISNLFGIRTVRFVCNL